MAGIGGFLNQISEEAIANFAERLQNSQNLVQLRKQRTKLVSAIAAVQQASANYGAIQQQLNKKQNLSAALQIMRNQQREELSLLDAVKRLYTTEHAIVNYLTKDATATESFQIMLDAKDIGGKAQYAYVSMTNKEINEMLDLDTEGNLILQRSKVVSKVLESRKRVNNIDPDEFEKFVTTIINTMWMQLQGLAKEISRQHAGGKLWKRYVELRAIFSITGEIADGPQAVSEMSIDDPRLQDRLTTIYNYYMQSGTLTSSVSYADIGKEGSATGRSTYNAAVSGNRGHVFEAYMRKLAHPEMSYGEAMAGSFGAKPWWAGGDVDMTQEKSMVGNVQSVQVASIGSMIQLASQLLMILDRATGTDKQNTKLQNQVRKKLDKVKNTAQAETFVAKVAKEAGERCMQKLVG